MPDKKSPSPLAAADYKSYAEWLRSRRYGELYNEARRKENEKNTKMSSGMRQFHHP